MDTNTIPQLAPATVVSTFNAWHVVALGTGAAIVHVYQSVVNAGGAKRIWRNFWDGPAAPTTTTTKDSPPS